MNNKKWYAPLLGAAAIISIIACGFAYLGAFANNINPANKSYELFIPRGSKVSIVFDSLKSKHILINQTSFIAACRLMGFNDAQIKEGHYVLKAGMSNYKLITKLRSGAQDAIRVTINNVRDIEELSGKMSRYLALDSLSLVTYLTDSTVYQKQGYTRENFLSLFIPNTYDMYWNISPEKFVQKMIRENEKFWNENDRLSKANAIPLKPADVYTLASIVEKESNFEQERPTIAGVYLNRLKINMKLQADPTVVYALGVSGLQRVLLEHLSNPSPYNTYQHEGLPPGPIYMPSINSIDAVLNAEKHDYIFFCAKEGSDGRHSFASTLQQHAQNARSYQKWLNQSHIR